MPLREVRDRRGRAQRGGVGLLERESALRTIDSVLAAAEQGDGNALLIEGHAGIGKTRLHEAALDAARSRGMRVLRASGAELETDIPLGLAAQLLNAQLRELPESRRALLMDRAPPRVRALAGLSAVDTTDVPDLSVAHGLFNLIATAEESLPTLIAIDDLQWADLASLEFILYLLHRLEELPVAIVMTARLGAHPGQAEVLDRIATNPRVIVQQLEPLGPQAVEMLVRNVFGERAGGELAAACHESTSGNPFFVHELMLALRQEVDAPQSELARRARALAPEAVIRTLRVRVGRLGPPAAGIARAVAVLGDDAELRHAAALSGLGLESASAAADSLAAVEILLPREPLRFVHPLVRSAIENDIPVAELASRHLEAARMLLQERAEPERVAAHLMLGRAEGAEWVVDQLRAAARDARARAAPQSAVRFLRRALAEPPDSDTLRDVLAELGAAELAAGMTDAAEHLARAEELADEPHRRAQLALQRGQALYNEGRYEEAAFAYDGGVANLPDDDSTLELRDELQTGFCVSATLVDTLRPRGIERSRELLKRAEAGAKPTTGQRLILAQAAMQASFAGEPAERVIELAERAWDDGRLLAGDALDGIAWLMAAGSLCMAGELERSIAIADQVLAEAQRQSAPLTFATASYFRSTPLRWQGQINAALADLELARDARRYGWRRFARSAAANFCLCLIETEEFEKAEAALTEDEPLDAPRDLEDARRLYALAELRLAQGRSREALDAALAAGAEINRTVRVFGYCPWRSAAAQAALALEDRQQALELAQAALRTSDETGVLHARIRGLRILGLCQGGEEGLGRLRAAAELGCSGPQRLEAMRALLDLGAAMRRANQRAAARAPLQEATDLAFKCGAVALYKRARTELAAAGSRPRRLALSSGPASLTPSERRIAELAAGGRSNREIAQILFVTPKTVEYHLRNAYRKLDIESRRELAQALAA